MYQLTKKEYNTYMLLNMIIARSNISRTQLAAKSGLRAATVTEITRDLIDKGIIRETHLTGSGRGRKRIMLELKDDSLCAIGISIEVNNITFIAASPKGAIYKKHTHDITGFNKASEIVNLIISVCLDLKEKYRNKIMPGIGVADPGLVDTKGESSIFSSQLKIWENIPLKSILADKTGLPAVLEVNERLKALGEKKYGLAKDTNDFFCVYLGEGIGMSMVSGGTLIKGAGMAAGEIGHSPVKGAEKLCICGKRGCLETEASLPAIISDLKMKLREGLPSNISEICPDIELIGLKHLLWAVKLKDPLCLKIIENAAIQTGLILSCAVNVLNPRRIIFDGALCEFGDPYLKPLIDTIKANVLAAARKNLRFEKSKLKDLAASLGAITMVYDQYFKSSLF